MLNERAPMKNVNMTHVILLPKVKAPTKISEFRPISLCNVIYKVVTKAIANRFKGVLKEIIGKSHSNFATSSLISDNVIAAFELMHSLKRKNNGRKGWC